MIKFNVVFFMRINFLKLIIISTKFFKHAILNFKYNFFFHFHDEFLLIKFINDNINFEKSRMDY